jgi:hypothetical protein
MFARRVVNTLKFFGSLFSLAAAVIGRIVPVIERIVNELDRFNGNGNAMA